MEAFDQPPAPADGRPASKPRLAAATPRAAGRRDAADPAPPPDRTLSSGLASDACVVNWPASATSWVASVRKDMAEALSLIHI